MRKSFAGLAALGIAGSIALTGCGSYPRETFCVDAAGHVMPNTACQVGAMGYDPGFMLWVGSTHGIVYHTGQVIPRTYYTGGTRVSPTDTALRSKLGLPSTGAVSNGYKPTAPAKPNPAPGKPSTSTTKSGTTTSKPGSSFGKTTTSRISSGFKSTFSGGRK